ncbi:MAG: type III pantothenate kinase [Bacteroidia bacterium]
MALAFDFGNTRLKAALFDSDNNLSHKSFSFEYDDDETFTRFLSLQNSKEQVIISSVNDQSYINRITDYFKDIVLLNYNLALPFQLEYDTPETLGKDRIAAAAGAMALYTERPLLVIDAGTCITYDFISDKNVYMGGAISPGIDMKLNAMHKFTNKLPLAKLSPDYQPFKPQKSTLSCLLEGAVAGTIHEIKGFIATFGYNKSLKVIINGGSGQYLADKIENSTFAAPNLVLIGLHQILKLNAQ